MYSMQFAFSDNMIEAITYCCIEPVSNFMKMRVHQVSKGVSIYDLSRKPSLLHEPDVWLFCNGNLYMVLILYQGQSWYHFNSSMQKIHNHNAKRSYVTFVLSHQFHNLKLFSWAPSWLMKWWQVTPLNTYNLHQSTPWKGLWNTVDCQYIMDQTKSTLHAAAQLLRWKVD